MSLTACSWFEVFAMRARSQRRKSVQWPSSTLHFVGWGIMSWSGRGIGSRTWWIAAELSVRNHHDIERQLKVAGENRDCQKTFESSTFKINDTINAKVNHREHFDKARLQYEADELSYLPTTKSIHLGGNPALWQILGIYPRFADRAIQFKSTKESAMDLLFVIDASTMSMKTVLSIMKDLIWRYSSSDTL